MRTNKPFGLIAILGLLFLTSMGCQAVIGGGTEEDSATPTPIPTPIVPDNPTYVVQRGSITKLLEFTGRVSPVEEETLNFKQGGYVKRVLVSRNDLVKEGDLVAELEIDDLLKQMAQAEVALNSSQLRLDEARDSLDRQTTQANLDLEAAQARLEAAQTGNADSLTQAELALTIAQEDLARLEAQQPNYAAETLGARIGLTQAQEALADAEYEYQKAQDRPWETPEALDGYARAVQQSQWNLEMAQARYAQAVAAQEVYAHDLNIKELQVTQAENNLAQLRRGVDPLLAIDVQRAQQQLDWLAEGVDPVLVNEVNQAELALERLQTQVAEAQIVAPMDGEVLSLSVYPGRFIEAFTPAVIIADPAAVEVSADLSSSQLDQLAEGQEASVVLSAVPGETWRATIRRLPYPYGTGGGTQGLQGADSSVRVSLDGDLTDLNLGDLARVTVVLEQKDDVLWLPPASIRTFQGRKFVIVQDSDRQRRVDVEVGVEAKERVEILTGLEEGQIVIGQ
jgi:multidrug efflux pump subunit AcrA (membrane-fusion protein)